MSSERVLLTSIGLRITAPSMRVAASRMSSIVGGCSISAWPSRSQAREQCYVAEMRKTFLALTAALLASPAPADTLVENANGLQVDAGGHLQHFRGLLIGDNGKIVRLLGPGEALPKAASIIDEHGRTVMPGLIDAHGHVLGLGFSALQLDLVGSSSLADLQQRLRAYA